MAVNVNAGPHSPYALAARLTNVVNGHDQPDDCPAMKVLARNGHIEKTDGKWVTTDKGKAAFDALVGNTDAADLPGG